MYYIIPVALLNESLRVSAKRLLGKPCMGKVSFHENKLQFLHTHYSIHVIQFIEFTNLCVRVP